MKISFKPSSQGLTLQTVLEDFVFDLDFCFVFCFGFAFYIFTTMTCFSLHRDPARVRCQDAHWRLP